jgi:outer membrane immunogenic protein
MKTLHSISLKALALALMTGSVSAADLPSIKGPAPIPDLPPLWTGVYAGVNIGGGWNASGGNNNDWYSTGFNNGVSNRIPAGALGGLQIGYNYQFSPMFVAGVETDFQGTTMGSGSSIDNSAFYDNRWGYSMGTSVNWFGTVRGRGAVAVLPSVLLFGTAGFAYGDVSRNGLAPNGSLQTGWTAGGGVEWMFLPNWSTKFEYLYTNIYGGPSTVWGFYPSLRTPIPMNVNNQSAWNTIRAGVNYHFAWGATTSITGAPISAPGFDVNALAAPMANYKAAPVAGYQSFATGAGQKAPDRRTASLAAPASAPAAASAPTSPIPGLAPATGGLPDISFSDIIHP